MRIVPLLTSYSRVLLEELAGSQPDKKFPEFYGTRRFITAFTSARGCLLHNLNVNMPQHIPLYYFRILTITAVKFHYPFSRLSFRILSSMPPTNQLRILVRKHTRTVSPSFARSRRHNTRKHPRCSSIRVTWMRWLVFAVAFYDTLLYCCRLKIV
jgi:hypothetical protein